MLDFIKVDVPKNNVFIAQFGKNKIKYVYYILKSYRNEKNQPTGKTNNKINMSEGYVVKLQKRTRIR